MKENLRIKDKLTIYIGLSLMMISYSTYSSTGQNFNSFITLNLFTGLLLILKTLIIKRNFLSEITTLLITTIYTYYIISIYTNTTSRLVIILIYALITYILIKESTKDKLNKNN